MSIVCQVIAFLTILILFQSDGSVKNASPAPTTAAMLPRADSVVTLGKFYDDDDFMGNFDEDGSFIGDYTQYNEENTQDVQKKLLYFSQFFNNNAKVS